MKNLQKDIKEGDKIYIRGSMSISNGSSDVAGGLATIVKITKNISGGKQCRFIEVEELPGHSYNWDQYLKNEQESLKKIYGKEKARPDPDIDTPWIENGDIVNDKKYQGKPIW